MEEPRDAAVFNGHDDGLVRVEATLSALGEEAVHDHGVPLTRRDVEAVLSQRTPGSGGEFIDLASQACDADRAHVCSGKGCVEPHDPRRRRSDHVGERVTIRSEERAVELLHKLAQLLLVHGEHSLRRRRRVGLVLFETSSPAADEVVRPLRRWVWAGHKSPPFLRPAAGSLGDLLRAQIGYSDLAKELRLPPAPGLLTYGLETTLVFPLENLHLGRKALERYPRAALRWHGRLCREVDVSLEEAQAILAALVVMAGKRKGNAAYALAELLSRRGLERPCETLVAWARGA
jgi:hypothetical protein